MAPASFVAWRCASLKYAGTVMTARSTCRGDRTRRDRVRSSLRRRHVAPRNIHVALRGGAATSPLGISRVAPRGGAATPDPSDRPRLAPCGGAATRPLVRPFQGVDAARSLDGAAQRGLRVLLQFRKHRGRDLLGVEGLRRAVGRRRGDHGLAALARHDAKRPAPLVRFHGRIAREAADESLRVVDRALGVSRGLLFGRFADEALRF